MLRMKRVKKCKCVVAVISLVLGVRAKIVVGALQTFVSCALHDTEADFAGDAGMDGVISYWAPQQFVPRC